MPKSGQSCSTNASYSTNVPSSQRRFTRSLAVSFPCNKHRHNTHGQLKSTQCCYTALVASFQSLQQFHVHFTTHNSTNTTMNNQTCNIAIASWSCYHLSMKLATSALTVRDVAISRNSPWWLILTLLYYITLENYL